MRRPVYTKYMAFDYHIESTSGEAVSSAAKAEVGVMLYELLYYKGFHDACEKVTQELGSKWGIVVSPREV